MIVVKFVMFAVLLFLSPFLQASDSIQTEIKTYEIESLDTLIEIFTKYNYTSRAWKAGHREVPRFMFEEVGENWKKTSKYLPVKLKKEVFFRLMAPLVLISCTYRKKIRWVKPYVCWPKVPTKVMKSV
mgnify:CR=1 FL=1